MNEETAPRPPRTSRPLGPIDGDHWEDRTRINARRALRLGWGQWLGGFDWQMMATLTFDPRRAKHHTDEHASREAFWWAGQVSRLNRRPVGWAYAVEGGGGGWPHTHVLLMGCFDSTWDAAAAMWRARNGRIDLTRVHGQAGAAAYLCKAIGPNGEVVLSDTLPHYRRAS